VPTETTTGRTILIEPGHHFIAPPHRVGFGQADAKCCCLSYAPLAEVRCGLDPNMEEIAVPDTTDQRPPVAVGHVHLTVTDVGAAAHWLEAVGLRPIVRLDALAVLELRGGTHVVVRQAERVPEPGTRAPFDLMVDDIDAAHSGYAEKGLSPSPIRRGRIHDAFDLAGPDGWAFTVNSSHASGRPI
jgi:hypothetical protein